MAKVGAQRAAELTGKSKSTIQRAMNSGKLSFEIDANERRQIDVSELERVFGLLPQDAPRENAGTIAELEKVTQMLETERLKMRIQMLEDQLDRTSDLATDLKDQRDQWQKQAQQVLLTSQYSQKQAEELKEELKARELRARLRREQSLQAQRQTAAQRVVRALRSESEGGESRFKLGGRAPESREKEANDDAFFRPEIPRIQLLWKKIRGQHEEESREPAAAAKPVLADTPKAA
jgi:hypothetical protein